MTTYAEYYGTADADDALLDPDAGERPLAEIDWNFTPEPILTEREEIEL